MEIEKGEIITLSDNREYVCLSIIETEDYKKFLYLMTTSEPIEFNFAEEIPFGGAFQIRIVGSKDEKHKLFDLLRTQSRTDSNQGVNHV